MILKALEEYIKYAASLEKGEVLSVLFIDPGIQSCTHAHLDGAFRIQSQGS